ncbi:MAG TPA: hypothetical protein VMY39_06990, partial [Planctomycetota bacterium]|nr:hypothetical protein [Planctomycetota bacterium]
ALAQEKEELRKLDDGYVRDWLVLTGIPFSLNPRRVDGTDAFIYGEADLRPREGYRFRSDRLATTRVLRWREHRAPDRKVDLEPLGGARETVSYLVTYLVSPKPQKVRIAWWGYPYRLVLLNGKPVGGGDVDLVEGRNAVMVRLSDREGKASFSLRVTTPEGQPIADVGVTLIPAEEEAERRLRSVIQPDPAFIVFPKPEGRISYLPDDVADEVKRRAAAAMKFIVDNQQAGGAWSDPDYPDSVGVTALCCLALMAEGNLPREGPHGKALDKGLEFLLASFRDEGVCASTRTEGYGPMYGHALAMLALLEASGNMPWRTDVEDKISRGIQTILRCQRLDGGWRYDLTRTGHSDISVTTTVLWTLGQARRYGYSVPKNTVERAVAFVEKCGSPDGRFSYRLSSPARIQPHSGVGVAALYGAGKIDHPLLPPARALIAAEYRRYSVDDLAGRRHLMFGSFFAALTMYSSGYETWSPWYHKMVQVIAKLQKKDGEVYDLSNNRMYPTALAAIILQAPNGYLSIFVQ